MIKVSIITVCLNAEKYIEETIKSVLSQTYKNIEYIVIDGGSTDGTLKILERYKDKISYLKSEPDRGIYDAMNKGIKFSTGEIICFLNSDDRFCNENVVGKVANFFELNKIDFVFGSLIVDLGERRFYYLKGVHSYSRFIKKRNFLRESIPHPASFFHKSCFQKAGYYDIRYKYASDYEWYLRALFKYHLRCAHLKLAISIFRCGGISTVENSMMNRYLYLETKEIRKIYFTSFEIFMYNFINLFLGGDAFRIVLKTLLGKKICKSLSYWKYKVAF